MKNVYVVHCIDTEGPLNESVEATFKRIKDLTGIEVLPSIENLLKIQNKSINLNGYEELASKVFSKRMVNYNRFWNDIKKMLDCITDRDFRLKYVDSFGKGWIYNWFIMDFAEYSYNPRNRDIGYNNVYNFYKSYYNLNNISDDDFQWHAHPMSIYGEANRCATSYINSPHIIQSLCHRVIDCHEFPNCYRPGFHTERSDCNWLLEEYIPFDFANQSIDLTSDDEMQIDLSQGRFGDWRRAPSTWEYYHPSHDDYQIPGNCHRTIFRCLNVGTRIRLITQKEVDKAFSYANSGNDIILAFCDHDYRDISLDIEEVYSYIVNSSKKFPEVKWINSKASDAASKVLNLEKNIIEIEAYFDESCSNRLIIKSNIDSFGTQPFFVIKTKSGRYINDNLDIQIPNRMWSYTFDDESVHFDDIDKIGLAVNSREGTGTLLIMNAKADTVFSKKW